MAGLKGKTGIVTGGSSGIGFQIANVLAQAGATVYVISRTGKPKEGVGESAPGVVHLRGDIGNAEAMKTLVTELAAKHNGYLDFLVNNAGVSYKCRAEDFPMEQFDNIMNVNGAQSAARHTTWTRTDSVSRMGKAVGKITERIRPTGTIKEM